MSEFIQLNSAFILAAMGMVGGCLTGLATCILKSRCTKISVCGCNCERDVLPAKAVIALNAAKEQAKRDSVTRLEEGRRSINSIAQ